MKSKNQKTAERTDVQRQINLPIMKAVEISIKSLKIRFGRSIITMGGTFLGIAFLMSIFTATSINLALAEKGSLEIQAKVGASMDVEASRILLVTLSLLVCTVGITNSMLMAVGERYREIGTMKCLGALDSFIVRLFLLESGFLGIIGSVLGAIVGTLIMIVVSLLKYGSEVMATLPISRILGYGVISVGIGGSLSIIAAIYPAYRAAKMIPAEAMRTEV